MMENINIIEKDGVLIVKFLSSFSFPEISELKNKLDALIKNGKKNIVFDLTDINWMDPFGMSLVAWVLKKIIVLKGQLAIVNPKRPVLELFKETRLSELVSFWYSVDQAVSHVNGR